MRGRRTCAQARGFRPFFLSILAAALSLPAAGCLRGTAKGVTGACRPGSLLGTGGPQQSIRRTIQELSLSESSEEVASFLCYCQALIHRDNPATMGRDAKDRPELLEDFGAQELKAMRKAPRRPLLRLLEGAAIAGGEPCDAYAWEALLRLDAGRFEALAASPTPAAPGAREKAALARRRAGRRESREK
jgi:hypothetical protein